MSVSANTYKFIQAVNLTPANGLSLSCKVGSLHETVSETFVVNLSYSRYRARRFPTLPTASQGAETKRMSSAADTVFALAEISKVVGRPGCHNFIFIQVDPATRPFLFKFLTDHTTACISIHFVKPFWFLFRSHSLPADTTASIPYTFAVQSPQCLLLPCAMRLCLFHLLEHASQVSLLIFKIYTSCISICKMLAEFLDGKPSLTEQLECIRVPYAPVK